MQAVCRRVRFSSYNKLYRVPQSNGAAERAVQTAKRIFRRAAADHKDTFERLLKYRNTRFEYIGVSPVQLLMKRRTRTMIPTHRRLLLPQAVDPDQVVKALKQRQSVSEKNYDRQSRDLPPLEAGDKVRVCPNSDREWRKADHTYCRMNKGVSIEETEGEEFQSRMFIQSVLHSMCPQLHDPPSPSSPTTEKQAPGQMKLAEMPAGNEERSPITTRSVRQVKKPQRLIESC